MPHATGDETVGEIDEGSAIRDFLRDIGGDGYGQDHSDERAIDQRDKADDAVDYEDISDEDDLPDEEAATNRVDSDADDAAFTNQVPGDLGELPVQAPSQPQTNGYHMDHDMKEQHAGDLFGDTEENHDLFGDRSSSPEQHRGQPTSQARPQRPGGLALPSKSSLALPGMSGGYQRSFHQHLQRSPESMSPPSSFQDDGYSPAESYESDQTDEAMLDPAELEQRKLFKKSARRQAGERVEEDDEKIDFDLFYSLFPRFETNKNLNFVDLFPPRATSYRGKAPFKPPRPVQPTKLSLDLLPDQEKSFRAPNMAKSGEDWGYRNGVVYLNHGRGDQDNSDDDLALSAIDENERIGGVTMQDLAVICGDWDIPSVASDEMSTFEGDMMDGEWEAEERLRPRKKQKTGILDADFSLSVQDPQLPFEEPERATAKLAKSVALDLNDPHLLIDEIVPQHRRRLDHSDGRRDGTLNKNGTKRYNISNDEAYDLLKENHQHKVRSTLGSMAVEHSFPATKLQYPFYRIGLDSKTKRSFHRPHLDLRDGRGREFRFQKLKHIKRKHLRGRDPKDLFAKAEDLYLGDNSNVLLLEYSEEAPMMMSNFGMGNRLINYYRKRDADDQERPKKDIGETHVLLTQDKSPFANFGHVDKGEIVPTIQNGMYRAPVFTHQGNSTDFLVGLSSTYQSGHRFYIRNVENLHTVGQQFPLAEVPGEHSRRVTDAAKRRLRALSYRIYSKSVDPTRRKAKPLNNENLMPHLPGHDMPQTRSKMREFMKYERAPGKDSGGTWIPMPGQVVPDSETIRAWIKPEDICLLDSMQVGVQHLNDLGLNDKKGDDDKEIEENANIELQLAPWRATKNFLHACQGKAMLKLHGEGDPTGRGEGFSFVKISMKGAFQAPGESAADKMDAKKRRETGGHSYNVAKQQKAFDDHIRLIWTKQKEGLGADVEPSDIEMEDDEEPQSTYRYGKGATPRNSFGTPAAFARQDDESASQFSKGSVDRSDRALTIARKTKDKYGRDTTTYEKVTNPRVIALYRKRKMERRMQEISVLDMNPTGDAEMDALKRQHLERELARISRNADRRVAREKAKGRGINSPAAGSPNRSDADGVNSATDGTPQKGGRGRNKDGTARKCANCGQVGHIKTNRKSVTFNCVICGHTESSPRDNGKANAGNGNGGFNASSTGSASAASGAFSYSKFTL